MVREDYLLRAIRQVLTTLLPYIRRMVQEQRDTDALATLAQTVRQVLGVPQDDVTFSLRNVLPYLRGTALTALDRDQRLVVATLLWEAGAIHRHQQRGDAAYACYFQALVLLLDTPPIPDAPAVPSEVPSVDELDRALRGYALPAATYVQLVAYYEQHGAYASAEDVLYLLRELDPQDPQITAIGAAVYQRLLRKPDAELRAGNMSRDEVVEGLARWQGHK